MKMTFSGIDSFIDGLSKLELKTHALAKSTLYEGAKVIADEAAKALQAIPVQGDKLPFISDGMKRKGIMVTGLTTRQKQDVINALGITRMSEYGGDVDVRIGFDGYTVNGKGEGRVPIAMLLRAHESGTSFIKKTPIVRKAFASARPKAKEAMQKHIDKVIKESFK